MDVDRAFLKIETFGSGDLRGASFVCGEIRKRDGDFQNRYTDWRLRARIGIGRYVISSEIADVRRAFEIRQSSGRRGPLITAPANVLETNVSGWRKCNF